MQHGSGQDGDRLGESLEKFMLERAEAKSRYVLQVNIKPKIPKGNSHFQT